MKKDICLTMIAVMILLSACGNLSLSVQIIESPESEEDALTEEQEEPEALTEEIKENEKTDNGTVTASEGEEPEVAAEAEQSVTEPVDFNTLKEYLEKNENLKNKIERIAVETDRILEVKGNTLYFQYRYEDVFDEQMIAQEGPLMQEALQKHADTFAKLVKDLVSTTGLQDIYIQEAYWDGSGRPMYGVVYDKDGTWEAALVTPREDVCGTYYMIKTVSEDGGYSTQDLAEMEAEGYMVSITLNQDGTYEFDAYGDVVGSVWNMEAMDSVDGWSKIYWDEDGGFKVGIGKDWMIFSRKKPSEME